MEMEQQTGPEKEHVPLAPAPQSHRDDSTGREGDDAGSSSGRNGSSSNSDPHSSQTDSLDRERTERRSLTAVVGDLCSSTTPQQLVPPKDDKADSSDDEDSASTEPPAGNKVGLSFSDDESPLASSRGYKSDENVERSKAPNVIAPSTDNLFSSATGNSSTAPQEESRPINLKGKFTYLLFKKGNNSKPIRKALNKRSDKWEATKKPLDSTSSLWTANFIWKPTWRKFRYPPRDFGYYATDRRKRQVVNHLRGVEPLCSKDLLYVTLRKYYEGLKKGVEDVVPTTIIIDPRDKVSCEEWTGWNEFEQSFRSYGKKDLQNLWLLKPSSTNRGVGIEIMNDIKAIQSFLEKKASGASMGLNPTWVLQKYIENPLLVHGRKFDIRVWVAVCDDGNAYIYGPGYIRTSSSIWTMEDLDREENRLVHLTNYCAQSKAANFGIFEQGNTLGFDQFAAFLDAFLRDPQGVMQAPEEYDSTRQKADAKHIPRASPPDASSGMELLWGENGLWKQIKDIIVHTMKALRVPSVHATSRNGCSEWGFGNKPVETPQHRFELLGYDFMLDSNLKPWLIEVNTNPSLTYQNRWHKKLVDQMMDELLRLVVDPVFEERGESNAGTSQDTSPTPSDVPPPGSSPKRQSSKKQSQNSPTRYQNSSHLACSTRDSAATRLAAAKSVGATHLVPEEERAAFAGSEEEEEDPYKTDAENENNDEIKGKEIQQKDSEESWTPANTSGTQQQLAVFRTPVRSNAGTSQQREWSGWKKATNIFKSKPVNSTQQQTNQPNSVAKNPMRPKQEGVPTGVLRFSGPPADTDSEGKVLAKKTKFDFVRRLPYRIPQHQNAFSQEPTKQDSSTNSTVHEEADKRTVTGESRRQGTTGTPSSFPKYQSKTSEKDVKSKDTQKRDKTTTTKKEQVTTPRRSNASKRSSSHPTPTKLPSQEHEQRRRSETQKENQVSKTDIRQKPNTGYSKDDGDLQMKKPPMLARSRIKPSWNNRSFQLQKQRQQQLDDRQTVPLAVTAPDLHIGGFGPASSPAAGNDNSTSVSDSAAQGNNGPLLMRSSSSSSATNKRRSYSSNGVHDTLDHLVDASVREQRNYMQQRLHSKWSGGDPHGSGPVNVNGTASFRQMMGQSVLHSTFASS
eukprot:gb/GECG01012522.1/.p1 GENE.gb/GECG01012522.1/~~gb/GECG01012522.1/.p1  ORF type:complete len:1130 (+),score=187.57 gb/GECG01012522.1/:1-3390(+)